MNLKSIKVILSLILVIFYCKIYAFSEKINSKLKSLSSEKQIQYLIGVIENELYDGNESTLVLADETYALAQKEDLTQFFAPILNLKGDLYFLSGDYELSKSFYNQALTISTEQEDLKESAKALLGIGNNYDFQKNYKVALKYMLESMQIREDIDDEVGLSDCYNNISRVYYLLRDVDKAIFYINKAIEIDMQRNDPEALGFSYSNLASYYYETDSLEQALEFQSKALAIREKLKNEAQLASSYNNMGNIFAKMKNYEKSVEFYKKSIAIKRLQDNPYNLAMSLNNLGETYLDFEKYDEAEEILLESKALLDTLEFTAEHMDNFKYLSNLYSKKGDYEQAFNNLTYYNEVRQMLSKSDKTLDEQPLEETKEKLSEIELESEKAYSFIDYYSFAITLICIVLFIMYLRSRFRE